MRVFSFGGGVQSTAVLVLAAQGKVQYDAFLFANVGEDSENPDTLAYVAQHARPYAERHRIRFEELRKPGETLLGWVYRSERSIRIPMRMANGAPGHRTCTEVFKINIIDRWIKKHGAGPHTVGLGISTDELQRARTSRDEWKTLEYPLLDLRLSRSDCARLIADAGLPLPPKSSCYFCPFKSNRQWVQLRHDKPALFGEAVKLERAMNERRAELGKDSVWLSQALMPLDHAFGTDQLTLDDALDTCESGYCMT